MTLEYMAAALKAARNRRDDAIVLLIRCRYHSWGISEEHDAPLKAEIDELLSVGHGQPS